MDWLRWWHGTVTDPKFQWVSRKSGQKLPVVVSLWAALLEHASTVTQCNAGVTRGNLIGFDCNDFDVLFGVDDGACQAIYDAMSAKSLIVDGALSAWDKRQPKREDSSAERVARHRASKKSSELNGMKRDVTQGNAPEEIREDKNKTLSSAEPDMPAGFQAFWKTWPSSQRKVCKAECLKKWKAKGLEAHAGKITAHVTILKRSQQWLDGYEPAPLTYLNQARWLDEIPASRDASDSRFAGAK